MSANGAGIAIVPRECGQPVLLVDLRDEGISVSVPLNGAKCEWTDVSFIENDTFIAAKTKDGKILIWPFYSDVRSVQKLAREHMPFLRGEDGSDGRLNIDPPILRRALTR